MRVVMLGAWFGGLELTTRLSDALGDELDTVDARTMQTSFPGVYAVGDVTSVGTPKAGVFAEGQAAVVADAVIAAGRELA